MAEPAVIKRAFVTGWPVEHSRSPLIHNHWIRLHHLEGEYVKVANTPEQFPDFVRNLRDSGFIGGNVTIPHKQTAFELVDHVDPAAQRLRAVNTIWLENSQLHGANTDGYGFLANLDDKAQGWDAPERQKRSALILGSGGAARAIIDAIIARGFQTVIIANRTVSKAHELAEHFGTVCQARSLSDIESLADDCALIINTTSVGMGDGRSPLELDGFRKDTIVNDIVYTPLVTPLLQDATNRGMIAIDGLGMLLHQAVPGFERWFGVRPQVTQELRAIILDDLGETA